MFLAKANCRCLLNQISSRSIHVSFVVKSQYDKLYTNPVARWAALDNVKNKLGLYKYNRERMKDATVYMYLSATDDLPVGNFFKHCALPDTYLSWFMVTQLHLWMIMTRCSLEGDDGQYVNKQLTERLWEDALERIKLLGVKFDNKTRTEIMKELHGIYTASLCGLDEGLQTNDKVLAAALWRHYFLFADVDPLILEMMVDYVRTQIQHISTLNGDYMLSRGRVIWKPFKPLISQQELPKLKVVQG